MNTHQNLIDEINTFDSKHHFKIWWLGQSGFLIKFNGQSILLDPYLSDSLTLKYKDTDKPHTRVKPLVLKPDLLENINIVSSSHNHTDHLDADTLCPIILNNPSIKFIIPEANRTFVADRIKCELDWPIGVNDDNGSFTIGDFEIICIPAAHNTIDRNELGQLKYIGLIVKFGGYAVYHSGDTLWYDGLDDILKSHNLDLALLPINGNKPERKVAGNLSFQEAADLAKAINCKWVIPHHYDMFEFNTEDPQNFEIVCNKLHVNYKVMEIGEGFEINK